LLERIEEDGTRTIGRFVGREFKVVRILKANASARTQKGKRSDAPKSQNANKPARAKAVSHEFDQLLARMQTPDFHAVMESLFHASPKQLGKAAVAAARKRSRRRGNT